jgi:hypothetical protein
MTLQQLLALLQQYRQQQSGQQPRVSGGRLTRPTASGYGRQQIGQSMQPGSPGSNSAWTPEAWQMMGQMDRNYQTPNMLGSNPLGLGLMNQYGFQGYQRNGQPIGADPLAQGGDPWQYGVQGQQGLGAASPSWGASNWMSDLLNMDLNKQNSNPYGGQGNQNVMGNGLGALFGENQGARYHGGGQGNIEFLNRGSTLASMDAQARGGGFNPDV